jgi:hypothetical protein
MRILIHGGMHKAASTSFQKLCFHYRKKLKRCGFFYPKIDKSAVHFNHSSWVDKAYYHGEFSWCKMIVEQALKRVGNDGCIILSAENLEYFAKSDCTRSGVAMPRRRTARLMAHR